MLCIKHQASFIYRAALCKPSSSDIRIANYFLSGNQSRFEAEIENLTGIYARITKCSIVEVSAIHNLPNYDSHLYYENVNFSVSF